MDRIAARAVRRMVISFVDIAGFARGAERVDDDRLAELLDRYYERVGVAAADGGGTLVKLIGDGALLVFPVASADAAVEALLALRADVPAMFDGWHCELVVKVHAGDVVCGPFGARGDKRFDVIGGDVNLAARLPTRSFALSAEAFRCLSPARRARFKKHTLPITYLPSEDRRPTPMTKL
jgi:adenylate cyclase|nr:adenylate/guanylate cyclase domain-containing protein [Kofleriaceae bacterium]